MKEKGIADEIVALSCGPPKSEVILTKHTLSTNNCISLL
jgi:electron transfer flavoprotein alpha/beta subunit